ncbi:MAG: acyl-CoA dehydrogenase family protein, partial [Cycloclasticus sp.]
MQQFQEERFFAMSKYLSQIQDAVDITIDYTKQRKAFGKPLIANQDIYFKLAEMQTDIQAVRALIHQACER